MLRYAVTAALMALAMPALADDLVFFHAPSGNIQCMIATGDQPEARCDILQVSTPVPTRPADCDLDFGHAFGIGLNTRRGYRMCVGDTVADPGGMTLPYGGQVDLGGFHCTSATTGMTCVNPAGHGFTLSKRAQVLF